MICMCGLTDGSAMILATGAAAMSFTLRGPGKLAVSDVIHSLDGKMVRQG